MILDATSGENGTRNTYPHEKKHLQGVKTSCRENFEALKGKYTTPQFFGYHPGLRHIEAVKCCYISL